MPKISMKKGTFKYLGFDLVSTREHNFTYDDNWLLKPATERNFDLLKLGFYLSVIPSKKEDILDFFDQLGYKYTAKTDYFKEGINVLAGGKVTDSVYYPAPVVDGKYYYNSIGYAIGYKKVKDATLIIAAIRGGNYSSEWGGNFNIGTGKVVEGFNIAADQVIDGIKRTIEENKLTGNIRLLTSGYSRAASVANLVSQRLSKGEIEGFSKENVYGFCFECPRNNRYSSIKPNDYENIISVSNPNDAITKLAESVFGYRRYGVTYYLPGVENDKDFYQKYAKMTEVLRSIIPYPLGPSVDTAYLTNMFVNDLAFLFGDLENYVQNYQDCLERATAVFFGGAKEEVPPDDLAKLGMLQQQMYYLNPTNARLISQYLGSKPEAIFRINFESPILQNHSMELNMAWLETINDFEDFSSNNYKIINIFDIDNAAVYDQHGTVLAYVKDRVISNEANRVYIEYDNNGQLIIMLNSEEPFKIQAAPKDKKVKISYARFSQPLGLKDRILSYREMPIKDFMEMNIPEGPDKDPTVIIGEEELKPEKTLSGKEVELYTVRIDTKTIGKTAGGGYYNYGDVAKVIVMNEYKGDFAGWFDGDTLVSEDPEYVFVVTESVELVPRFNN